jgi:hypothetical protein
MNRQAAFRSHFVGVDFETALGALLKTPPPSKDEAPIKPKRRRKA